MTDERCFLDLTGTLYKFHGEGAKEEGEFIETEEFSLSKGALIAYFEHQGAGRFKVSTNRVSVRLFRGLVVGGLFESEGPGEAKGGWLVKDGLFSDLIPGVYKLRVEARGKWFCSLFQPALGRSSSEFPVQYSGYSGDAVAGTFRVGPRPLLVKGRHDGIGQFVVTFISLDGTDECEVIDIEGQTNFEDRSTEAKPGKEYIVLVKAGGNWELEFTQGY